MNKHQFELTSYSSPTYCNVCSAFIWGVGKQGYSCKVCGKNVHKKCLEKMFDDCGKQNNERQISGPVVAQSLVPNKQPQQPPLRFYLFIYLQSRGNPNNNTPRAPGVTSPPPMKGNPQPPPMAPRPNGIPSKSSSAQTIPTYNPSQRVEEQEATIKQQMETIRTNENTIKEQEIRLEANAREIEEQEKALNEIQMQIDNLTKQFENKQVITPKAPLSSHHGSIAPSKSAPSLKKTDSGSLNVHRPSQSNKLPPEANSSSDRDHSVNALKEQPKDKDSSPTTPTATATPTPISNNLPPTPAKAVSSPPVKQDPTPTPTPIPPTKQSPVPPSTTNNNTPTPNPPVKHSPTPLIRQASTDQPQRGNSAVKESQNPPIRPNRPTINQPKRLEDANYYFGNIDRKQAEEYLSSFGGNCFLIRDSSVKGAYAISYLHKQKGFNHTLILQVNGGYKLQEANDIFPTVWDVINKDPELATFTPLDKHRKKSIVKVQIPDVKVVASIPSESNISVNDLVKTMLVKAGITNKPEEYGLYSPEDNLWLPGDKNFASVVQAANYKAPLILQRRDQIHIKVKYNNKEYPLNVKKDSPVKEIIEKIKEIAKVTSPIPLVLQVLKAEGEDPIIMDEKKVIRSYNLNISDSLELKEEKTEKEEKEEQKKGKQIFVKVESPDASSLLKIGVENTIQDLIDLFLKKSPVSNPSGYGLLKFDGKKKKKTDNVTWLDPRQTLASYGIKNKDTLVYKQKLRNRSVSKMEGIIKTQMFGVDPSSLECVVDAGYKVPRVLVSLKMAMMKHRGFEIEGIFRLSGSESKLKDIKYQLNTSSFDDCDDMHCCASLIKRWYGELPNRLFSSLSSDQIDTVQNDVNESWALVKKLPEPERSLYMWLIELLCNVARNSEITKMVPANLAICVAPQMMNINIDNPMEAILMNQQICNVVKNTIVYKLRDQELGALGNYARAPSDPDPEIEVSQEN